MKELLAASIFVTAFLSSAPLLADSGDCIENRLDHKGDRVEDRLDRCGDRIENHLDHKGDRIDVRLDRKGGALTVASRGNSASGCVNA